MSILKKDYRSTIMAKFNYLSILFIHSIKKRFRITFVAGLAIVLGATSLVQVFSGAPVAAGTVLKPINLVFYGTHDTAIDQQIVAAKPMFLIDNTPGGPWGGNCNASYFAGYGIKVFSYIDGGYEGTQARSIPNDLTSNLNYIDAISKESGVYGVFVDEVSAEPSSPSLNYLSQIYARAKQDGLAVMFNTGEDSWSDSLMQYCDYINSSEEYSGGAMTASQQKWASRTVLLAQNISDAVTAANLTNTAIAKGFLAEYSCSTYENLPSFLASYVSLITGTANQANHSPVFVPIGDKTTTVGTDLQFTISANDAEANSLTYSIASLPAGATFDAITGTFSWTPTVSGIDIVTFTVSDGTLTDSQTITITVQAEQTTTSTPVPTTTIATTPINGNTTAVVASEGIATGALNEYDLYVDINSTTVSGLNPGQEVWCAASTTDFPGLLTEGTTIIGNIGNSAGWWVFKNINGGSQSSTFSMTESQAPAWDVNGDHVCNVTDVIEIGLHFNKSLSDPGYAANCDVDGNGVININDIIMVGLHWNQTW